MILSASSPAYPNVNIATTKVIIRTRNIAKRQRRKKRSLFAFLKVSPTDASLAFPLVLLSTRDGRLTEELDFNMPTSTKKSI